MMTTDDTGPELSFKPRSAPFRASRELPEFPESPKSQA